MRQAERSEHLSVPVGIVTIFVAWLLAGGVSWADVPPPGMHGATKAWLRVGAKAVNFSPFTTMDRIAALTPDSNGGVWFGAGNTLEHIDQLGRMRDNQISPEWLWQIRGLSYDRAGRLWFALGESGRIGTTGADGKLKTRILVARKYFADIRQIAFDEHDTLWFTDDGRRSIGRRTADGAVREVRLPDDGYRAASLAICHSSVWIAVAGARSDTIYSVKGDLDKFRPVLSWRRDRGWSSIACDAHGNVWFAHAPFQARSVAGFLDRRDRVHEESAVLQNESVHAGAHGSIWFTGFEGSSPADWSSSRLVLARPSGDHLRLRTLPIFFGSFSDSLTTSTDGRVWMNLAYPHSVVRLEFAR